MRFAAVLLAGCAAQGGALQRHVDFLASPALEGRAAGSPGEHRAADYVAAELQKLGYATERQDVPFEGANLYARLRGARDEWIVVGAHLDHLGERGERLFPGADDNASGVAVVLGIAQRLAHAHPERSILFVFFTAEEEGMIGSRFFVEHLPVARVAAMINLDMVGRVLLDQAAFRVGLALARVARDAIGLLGARHYPALRALVDRHERVVAAEDMPDAIGDEVERQSNGRSDSVAFEEIGVPSLFFGDGESRDYHRPTDVPAVVDPALLERRADRIAAIALELANAPSDVFARSDAQPPKPYVGLYGIVGADVALAFEHGTHAAVGGHASLAYVGAAWFAGASADLLHVDGSERFAIGPEVGLGPVGLELDTVFTHGTRGVAVRPFLSVGTVSLSFRLGEVEGRGWFGDLGLSLALPVRIF